MTIYVSSTTGTQQDVDDAANYDPDRPKESPKESSEVEETESAAEPEPATEEDEESTEEKEPSEEGEEEEPEAEEPPEAARRGTKSRLVHRVNQLVGQRYALQDENHQLREQIRQLQEGQNKDADKAPQQPQALRRPEPSDAKYKGRPYEEFVEDLADFKVKERELLKAQAEQEAFVRSVFDDYNAQVEVARGKFEDFDEVVGKEAQVPVVAINAMYELDNGPEVAYYLGKHPEVREQLLDWNEPGTKGGYRRIVVELDRISRELEEPSSTPKNGRVQSAAQSSPRPRSATPTPAPIRPLGTASASAGPATAGDPSKMDYQQYKRWYQKHYGR